MGLLENRVVIVTGGGHGIGRAFCLGLASEGARVVVAELDAAAAQATASELKANGTNALAVETDVSDETSVNAMIRQVMDRFGRVDALVNNAAMFTTVPISQKKLADLSVDEWDRVLAVNLHLAHTDKLIGPTHQAVLLRA